MSGSRNQYWSEYYQRNKARIAAQRRARWAVDAAYRAACARRHMQYRARNRFPLKVSSCLGVPVPEARAIIEADSSVRASK